MACLSGPYSFKFFKGCLPQLLLGPLLNTLPQIKQAKLLIEKNSLKIGVQNIEW